MDIKKPAILIADDHDVILNGMHTYLSKSFPNAKLLTATNKIDLFQQLKSNKFDLLLLDIQLGKDHAREFIEAIMALDKRLKICILSSHEDASTIAFFLNKGVYAFVGKSEPIQTIKEAVDSILKDKKFLSNHIKDTLEYQKFAPDTTQKQIKLTKREKEILSEILKEKSTKEIADHLFITTKTVEHHRSNLFIKFDVKNVAGLVKKAIVYGME